MPVLQNQRHELFAQAMAQGKTAQDAYELAGYRPNSSNASNMARKQHIRERLTEINNEAANRTVITKQYLIEKVEELRVRAMESGELSAGITAIKEVGVLTGHRIERAEVGAPGEFDHPSDDELLTALRERFSRLMADVEGDTRH